MKASNLAACSSGVSFGLPPYLQHNSVPSATSLSSCKPESSSCSQRAEHQTQLQGTHLAMPSQRLASTCRPPKKRPLMRPMHLAAASGALNLTEATPSGWCGYTFTCEASVAVSHYLLACKGSEHWGTLQSAPQPAQGQHVHLPA